ncbi:MCP four helix bundle domain-containing protein [Nonlabens sp. Asnod3-H03]|uniref:MCP four helix bundle domain-containing protein n=1 Tax=Nonlabens sp. Asnod3-H03 TaxID=3160580 RepID=UPI0038661046
MVSNKIKWSVGLFLVIALILATNFIDRNNFKRVQDSVSTIYEDRLVAKDLIYDIQLEIHEKELLIALNNTTAYLSQKNEAQDELNDSMTQFSTTKLTLEEEKVFNNLQTELAALFTLENATDFTAVNGQDNSRLQQQLDLINETLLKLSDIQIKEGNRQMHIGKKAMASMELLTQMEVWIMIILAVIIQVIILYNPKK